MRLTKHTERGYGHAEKTTSSDGRDRYLVRFFDGYNSLFVFSETAITKKILEFPKEE